MSYTRRHIDVKVAFGLGDNGEQTPDTGSTLELKGLRVSANIIKAGDPGFDTASVRIWGMTPTQMNKITTLGKPLQFFRDNTITLSAGDDDSGMATVFIGVIQSAYQDFNGAPDASINIAAFVGLLDANRPIAPISYPGGADAAQIATTIAASMTPPLTLENGGVQVQLSNPYFPGSPRAQLEALAKAANFNWTIDNNVLAIWPKDGKRGGAVPLISPETGLVGYPQWTDGGVGLRTVYQPGVIFGGEVRLQSSIKPADGAWTINRIEYELESELPGGAWYLNLEGYRFGNIGG